MGVALGHGEHVAVRVSEPVVSPWNHCAAKLIGHVHTHIHQSSLRREQLVGINPRSRRESSAPPHPQLLTSLLENGENAVHKLSFSATLSQSIPS